ncbi:hypothetical protein FISHEDRAFT_34565 [Fistulina hepatica ATCC 64428]|uniref:Uncharacterized protein n=1 Tax=Fistulina hepatica ATCC 64428 TaxID=1128425 RepID=A0A0D7ALJ5_9AGAR|nr:hypothetical protein FISHEDRAFT_34565 [Fistulina hepatica ATCC 64428]
MELPSASPPNLLHIHNPSSFSLQTLPEDQDDARQAPVESVEEEELAEEELRELYDNEEIERFIELFSAYVTEVRVPDSGGYQSVASSHVGSEAAKDDWMSLNESRVSLEKHSDWDSQLSFAEWLAQRYVVPMLPPEPMPTPPFTLGRFRLTLQRLYLTMDKRISARYCAIFWLLWLFNLLIPAFFFHILYALLRRRLWPYPTLEELRARRKEVHCANTFSVQFSERLSASSLGVREVWRLFKVYSRTKKFRAGHISRRSQDKVDDASCANPIVKEAEGMATILDDSKESEEERDLKQFGLHVLCEIADLHERLRNIFIWRRPQVSRRHGYLIAFLAVATLILPERLILKGAFMVLGFIFWHVVPVIAALPPADYARIPPPFWEVPTDADYAMEVISKRVSEGLDIRMPRRRRKTANGGKDTVAGSTEKRTRGRGLALDMERLVSDSSSLEGSVEEKESRVDWKKWGERAATGKAWADDRKRLITGKPKRADAWPPKSPLIPGAVVAIGQTEMPVETSTFPAQYGATSGLITLTPYMFYFTPLMSSTAKIMFPLRDLRGVKKAGLLKGLLIRWKTERIEKEEKFQWVGGRDELFARLLGPSGKKWIKV